MEISDSRFKKEDVRIYEIENRNTVDLDVAKKITATMREGKLDEYDFNDLIRDLASYAVYATEDAEGDSDHRYDDLERSTVIESALDHIRDLVTTDDEEELDIIYDLSKGCALAFFK